MSTDLKLRKPILDPVACGRGRRISKGVGKASRCLNSMVFIMGEVVSGQYTYRMEPEGVEDQYKSLGSGICRILTVELKAASRTGHSASFVNLPRKCRLPGDCPRMVCMIAVRNPQKQLFETDEMFAWRRQNVMYLGKLSEVIWKDPLKKYCRRFLD